MPITKGKFLTLEGGEGCGKTTNLNYIADYLRSNGVNLITTREPGGTEISEKIRSLLLDKNNVDIHADTELLMMFAARAQHLQQKILPAINNGQWVLSDRFTDSTFAYQGAGRGIEVKKIEALEQWVQAGFTPDKTFILDLPIEVGMERAAKRAELDRFESEKHEFFNHVRQGFLQRAKQNPSVYSVIDATGDLKSVQHKIKIELDKLL
ncbi:MAG: dTMP kinase [Gammaproteobacteria bacterium]|nr:dTMP kinase [Gammaproteobacteria bacterium]